MYSFLKNQRNYSVTLEKIYLMQKKAVKEGQIDKKRHETYRKQKAEWQT